MLDCLRLSKGSRGALGAGSAEQRAHPQDQVRTREWRGKGGGGVPGSRLGGAGLGALGIPDLSAPEQVLESGQTWRLRTGLSCPKAGALRGS